MGGGGRARERSQKGFDRKYNDWGVSVMTEQDIRQRLARQEYPRLAGSPDAPPQIKVAAGRQALAVWTKEYVVTIDDSRIDGRPGS
jgi:hypothetical protein